MLEEAELAAGPQHPPELGERARHVRDGGRDDVLDGEVDEVRVGRAMMLARAPEHAAPQAPASGYRVPPVISEIVDTFQEENPVFRHDQLTSYCRY